MKRERFQSLWDRVCGDGTLGDAGAVFDELLRYYSGDGRHYHSPEHIDHCLRQFDIAAAEMDDPDAVEMALWFHDVIYDAGAADNELRSAELFVERVGPSVDASFRDKVYGLIMITTHRDEPTSKDERFIVDIDLSSFGLPWDQFVRDSIAVRGEFPHLTDEVFFPKQREFFEALLSRGTFCYTEFFRDRHERSARENITRHLENLKSQGLA